MAGNPYVGMARKAARKHGVPERLFLAMIDTESSWRSDALSNAGAIGLGQLMPGTAGSLGVDPWNPAQNLDGAARHLKAMFRRTQNWRDALRAYNQGYAGSQRGPSYGAEYASTVLSRRSKYAKGGKLPGPTGATGIASPSFPDLPSPGVIFPGTPRPGMVQRQTPGGMGLADLASVLFAYDPEQLAMAQSVAWQAGPTNPVNPGEDHGHFGQPSKVAGKHGVSYNGDMLVLPTQWKATHVTDGLSEDGFTSAVDIMAKAGTGVGAPEAGTIVYFHPTGAQGGGSMLLRTRSGREYWIGHIDQGLPAGTKVQRGDRIAVVSSDHRAPHVHLDRRG